MFCTGADPGFVFGGLQTFSSLSQVPGGPAARGAVVFFFKAVPF